VSGWVSDWWMGGLSFGWVARRLDGLVVSCMVVVGLVGGWLGS